MKGPVSIHSSSLFSFLECMIGTMVLIKHILRMIRDCLNSHGVLRLILSIMGLLTNNVAFLKVQMVLVSDIIMCSFQNSIDIDFQVLLHE